MSESLVLPDFLVRDADGWIHVAGHRIGLETIVRDYAEGFSVETLAAEYPTLSLAVLHRLIAFYLDNRPAVDAYVQGWQDECRNQREAADEGVSLAELRRRATPAP